MVLYGANAACRELKVEPMSVVGFKLSSIHPSQSWFGRLELIVLESSIKSKINRKRYSLSCHEINPFLQALLHVPFTARNLHSW